jgi:hypothetical protein
MGNAAEKVWGTHAGLGVALFDAEPANDTSAIVVPQFKWIHCANEGLYEGHHQGSFNLTRAVFEQFIRNFRENPQFRAGSKTLDGGQTYTGGIEPVLQFDYEHASEVPCWEGTIPETGAPAQGWVLDVAIREGANGGAQLWAFSELLDDVRTKIAKRQIRWVSIAFALEALDWKTAKPRGPTLTSIAFTNHPFMQDLTPLQLSRRASQPGKGAIPSSGESPEAPGGGREPTRTGAIMDAKCRERVCKALKINLAATDEQVGDAVDAAVAGNNNLQTVLEALGVPLTGEALKVIPQLRDAKTKVEGVLRELNELLTQEAQADAAIAQADVGAAMSAGKLGEGARTALGVYRASLIGEATTRLRAEAKVKSGSDELTLSIVRGAIKAGREKFLAEHGVADPSKVHLATNHVAGAGDTQLTPPTTAKPMTIDQSKATDGGELTIDLRGVDGENTILRIRQWCVKNDAGFTKLTYPMQIKRASELKRCAQLTLE